MRQVEWFRFGSWAVLIGALFFGGCTRYEPPRFAPGAALAALPELGADDEEKKELQELQKQIEQFVLDKFGTATSPVIVKGSDLRGHDKTWLEKGEQVFSVRCQQCHGVNGDGAGAVAEYLAPPPRDYTKGIFKFTSTPYGSKPRRADLLRTLRQGVRGTSMPTFVELDPQELEAVADYVVYLAQRGEFEQKLVALAGDELELPEESVESILADILASWQEAQSQVVMPVTPMPAMTAETIEKGRALFFGQVCNKCHGLDGRGGLAGKIDIGKDVWGHNAAAADLTSGMYRGGGRPLDLYRRIYSGINGTPMPGFAKTFEAEPDNIWYLVHYVRSTGERRRKNEPPPANPAEGIELPKPTDQPAEAAPSSEAGDENAASTSYDRRRVG
ncbi:MAG: c-type cytochrome [Pirellulales bacterium]|nr:c-type cytochrome [Pirellulales bacterium]